jgi:hypothetical protein
VIAAKRTRKGANVQQQTREPSSQHADDAEFDTLPTPVTVRRGSSRGQLVGMAAGVVALVALVLAAIGPVPVRSAPATGPGAAVPAAEDASATLLSGYAARNRPARAGTPQVFAASVQVVNPTDTAQRYFVTLTFEGADSRPLLERRLVLDAGPDATVVRDLYTRAERPPTGVVVRLDVSRAPRST